MKLKNKKYISLFAYLLVSHFAFSMEAHIVQNGKKQEVGNEKITLKHDFTKMDQKVKEAEEYSKKLFKEGKISGVISGTLYPFSGEEALSKTGVIFDFKLENNNANSASLTGKKLDLIDGTIDVTAMPWNLYGKDNIATIENSEINIKKTREYPYYHFNDDDMMRNYYESSQNYLQLMRSIEEKEKYLDKLYVSQPIYVGNSYLYLKNSTVKVDAKKEDNTNDLIVREHLVMNRKDDNKNFNSSKAGLQIIRDGEKLEKGKYDLELSNSLNITLSIEDNFAFSYYNKDSIKKWYQNRFHSEKGRPLFLLGKNAKLKAGTFRVDNSNIWTYLYMANMFDLMDVYFNKDNRMIVFEKDSEADLEKIEIQNSNLKFEDAIVRLKNANGPVLISEYSQITGRGIFDIYGQSILKETIGTGDRIDKNLFFTDLEFLPGSKMDLSFIQDAHRNYFSIDTGIEEIKDDALKGGEYKFTFHNNTNTYLGYSQRNLNRKIQRKPDSNEAKGIGLKHASDADMNFQEGSHLYLYREKYAKDTLKKGGTWKEENDEQGNLLEFTGRLHFDNANIHFRSNLKEELSDRLIASRYPITGTGAKLHIKNSGATDTTGKERLTLIEAKKGVGADTKFTLPHDLELGGYVYTLHEKISADGAKEYYLASGVVEGVRPENSEKPKEIQTGIPDSSSYTKKDSIHNQESIDNQKIRVEAAGEDYAISWEGSSEKEINIQNSHVAAKGKKGILVKNSKVNLKASELSATDGMDIDGTDTNKERLLVDKDSSLYLEHAKGGAALAVKEAGVKFDNSKKILLKGTYAIYSNGGNIAGNGIFNINGNIYHKGKGGIDLTLEKGSVLNTSSIDIAGNRDSSKLHFKAGSAMYINNYSNTNMIFDKGSALHTYAISEANQHLDIYHKGNKVIFTQPIAFHNTDIYFRTNMDEEESDKLELLGSLSGTSANLHLMNHAEADMPAGGKKVELVYAKSPKNFKWNLANQVEVGGYFYNAVIEKTSQGPNQDIISVRIGDAGTRKATLSSTAKGVISNSVSDYTMYHSFHDSLFDSLYSNDYSSQKLHSIWAKTSGNTFETKEYGMKNEVNTILVGMDRALNAEEGLYGGFFAGNLHNSKKISSSSGKGSFQGFTGGAYLSYRGYLGFGDAFVAYTTGKSKYHVLDTASATVTNDRNSKHLGAGLRFGRQFFMDNGEHFYVEPSAKITYGRLNAETSKASNGLMTKVDAIKSWTTGAYARVGYQNQFTFGKINSYAKVGVTQEILGKYSVRLNQSGVEQVKLDGNTMNYGVGLEYSLGNNSISFDFDVKNSPILKNYYKVSLGYQYKF
ncbi:outer membrane autotransporter barrel domain protein [Fusobacterium gonidiaformans 3-1-5R]|uniref:Outer membrane autotransporter barrel domain protein n=1 Tax=Fusobacterium gonidiaformans 3-1-5R TaxID=469605 RepID=E5BGI9_9FUSO|nr:autotransporter outer membrane beta-barrel domain-containing protein [Fusobacterium gonidiaformans]EFS21612.1 outer membrane autotransporter barrel domain protein [Fusobacterium gonidiaformans 3-1-5R]